jgi:predicted ATP-binding protein involved in virulence
LKFEEIRISSGIRAEEASIVARGVLWGEAMEWTRAHNRNRVNNSGAAMVSTKGTDFRSGMHHPDNREIAPLIAYYSTQRLFADVSVSQNQQYDPASGRLNGYLKCLDERSIKPVLIDWLGNAVTRRATMQIQGIPHRDHVLENVESGIKLIMRAMLDLSPDISLQIYQDPDWDYTLFLKLGDAEALAITQYSDGFRNIIFLVLDMIWRASQLNPWLDFEHLQSQTSGIVMIDEVDLHLHPKWQAKVLPALGGLFPQVQFLVTTHSPTIVANFESKLGQLHAIHPNSVIRPTARYFGKEINEVLQNILGAKARHAIIQD